MSKDINMSDSDSDQFPIFEKDADTSSESDQDVRPPTPPPVKKKKARSPAQIAATQRMQKIAKEKRLARAEEKRKEPRESVSMTITKQPEAIREIEEEEPEKQTPVVRFAPARTRLSRRYAPSSGSLLRR